VSGFQIAFILVLLTALALVVVWERAEATNLGYRLRELSAEKRRLLEQRRELQCELSRLCSPKRIAEEVETRELALMSAEALSRDGARQIAE